jgi:chaperonin GroES
MKKYIALNDVVIIKQDDASQTNAAGFYTNASTREAPWSGTVVSLGETVLSLPSLSIGEGDRVYFKKYAGHEIEIDNEKLMLVPYEDILLKIN